MSSEAFLQQINRLDTEVTCMKAANLDLIDRLASVKNENSQLKNKLIKSLEREVETLLEVASRSSEEEKIDKETRSILLSQVPYLASLSKHKAELKRKKEGSV